MAALTSKEDNAIEEMDDNTDTMWSQVFSLIDNLLLEIQNADGDSTGDPGSKWVNQVAW